MPKPPPFKKRPGSSLPAGRNYQGNRFGAPGEEAAEGTPGVKDTAKEDKAEKGNPFAKGKKSKKKGKRPALPPQAMGLAQAMMMGGKK